MAHLRQIQSFLLMGHEVIGLCRMQGPEGDIPFVPGEALGLWKGMRQLPKVHLDNGYTEAEIVNIIVREVTSFQPDVIIIGNLHGARWPLDLIIALRDLDSFVVAYMHDCYLISGRCAYMGSCRLYETGCNERCPTFTEYPQLSPDKIAKAWKLRRRIFCGPHGIPLATNSCWTLEMAQRSLEGLRYADVVYLGLDERLFSPIDRELARQLLGLPQDRFLILGGSVNVTEKRKGGHFLKEIVSSLASKADFLVFGQESFGIKRVNATGLLRDYRKMPLLFSAADLFVGTAVEEAFGMTLCEASACGIPSVAFNIGGVPEIARHNINARLSDDISASGLLKEIEFFMDNPGEREAFGRAGREIVETEFTLQKQGERWMEYLKKVTFFECDNNICRKADRLIITPDMHYIDRRDNSIRPSWKENNGYVNEEHKAIFDKTKDIPGWQMEGDTYKLYEMGYFAGDVILEIGTFGGRSAVVEILGALSAGLKPQFFGIEIDINGIKRTQHSLQQFDVDEYALLYHGTLQKFMKAFSIQPTMCFVDGDHLYEDVKRDLDSLSELLCPGVPVLCHDYLNPENDTGEYGVRKAATEWEEEGYAVFYGAFGCSGFFVTTEKCRGRHITGMPAAEFDRKRRTLLGEYGIETAGISKSFMKPEATYAQQGVEKVPLLFRLWKNILR